MHASASSGVEPDVLLPVIAATLRSSAAGIELLMVEQIGGLATAIFRRVARADGDARGLFSAEAAAEYAEAIGHGLDGVTNPFVQEIWSERQALLAEG